EGICIDGREILFPILVQRGAVLFLRTLHISLQDKKTLQATFGQQSAKCACIRRWHERNTRVAVVNYVVNLRLCEQRIEHYRDRTDLEAGKHGCDGKWAIAAKDDDA